jgi:hypothetical protein
MDCKNIAAGDGHDISTYGRRFLFGCFKYSFLKKVLMTICCNLHTKYFLNPFALLPSCCDLHTAQMNAKSQHDMCDSAVRMKNCCSEGDARRAEQALLNQRDG